MILIRLVAVVEEDAAIEVLEAPDRHILDPRVRGLVVTRYSVLDFRLMIRKRVALAVLAVLMAVCRVEMEPEVSLIVVTVSPVGCW